MKLKKSALRMKLAEVWTDVYEASICAEQLRHELDEVERRLALADRKFKELDVFIRKLEAGETSIEIKPHPPEILELTEDQAADAQARFKDAEGRN